MLNFMQPDYATRAFEMSSKNKCGAGRGEIPVSTADRSENMDEFSLEKSHSLRFL